MRNVLLVLALCLGASLFGFACFWAVLWLLSQDSLIATVLAMVLGFVLLQLAVWFTCKLFFKE